MTEYKLPRAFITTVVGSYPRFPEAQEALEKRRRGLIDEKTFREMCKAAIKKVVEDYISAGIDIISDGEQTREDMVVHFTERMNGYKLGDWVRIFDNVYFRKPIVVSKVEYREQMILEDWEYAQSLSQGRPVKFIITGPYTIVDWSFNLHYKNRRELVIDVAKALRKEIEEAVKRGAKFVQIDEPALSTRPLPEEAELLKEALKEMLHGLDCKKIVHICFGRIEKIIPYILDYPVDQFDLEFKNSNFRLLPYLKEYSYNKELGFGVVDVHTLRVESVEEIKKAVYELLKLDIVGPEKVYLDPDCGLKRLPRDIALAKLRNIAKAAQELRKEYGYE